MCQSEGCPRIDWRRPPGRPRHTCMATHPGPWMQISNFGLNSARKYAQDREHWKDLVETAMLQLGTCAWWWWWWWTLYVLLYLYVYPYSSCTIFHFSNGPEWLFAVQFSRDVFEDSVVEAKAKATKLCPRCVLEVEASPRGPPSLGFLPRNATQRAVMPPV